MTSQEIIDKMGFIKIKTSAPWKTMSREWEKKSGLFYSYHPLFYCIPFFSGLYFSVSCISSLFNWYIPLIIWMENKTFIRGAQSINSLVRCRIRFKITFSMHFKLWFNGWCLTLWKGLMPLLRWLCFIQSLWTWNWQIWKSCKLRKYRVSFLWTSSHIIFNNHQYMKFSNIVIV